MLVEAYLITTFSRSTTFMCISTNLFPPHLRLSVVETDEKKREIREKNDQKKREKKKGNGERAEGSARRRNPFTQRALSFVRRDFRKKTLKR